MAALENRTCQSILVTVRKDFGGGLLAMNSNDPSWHFRISVVSIIPICTVILLYLQEQQDDTQGQRQSQDGRCK